MITARGLVPVAINGAPGYHGAVSLRGAISRRDFVRCAASVSALALIGAAGSGCGAAAVGRKGSARVGFLGNGNVANSKQMFDQAVSALRTLGYAEGQNITFEPRFPASPVELNGAASELAHLNLDVIMAQSDGPALLLKQVTSASMVLVNSIDPISNGLVESLARPGGNITGYNAMAPELGAKWLELLKAVVPGLSRVSAVYNNSNQVMSTIWQVAEPAARSLSAQLKVHPAPMPEGIEGAVQAVSLDQAEAIVVLFEPGIAGVIGQLVDYATYHRIPTLSQNRAFAVAGGLLVYGFDLQQQYSSVATYVDKILKGARPADLPVERPTKFNTVVNLKAAAAIGLTIPQAVLGQATEVIQ